MVHRHERSENGAPTRGISSHPSNVSSDASLGHADKGCTRRVLSHAWMDESYAAVEGGLEWTAYTDLWLHVFPSAVVTNELPSDGSIQTPPHTQQKKKNKAGAKWGSVEGRDLSIETEGLWRACSLGKSGLGLTVCPKVVVELGGDLVGHDDWDREGLGDVLEQRGLGGKQVGALVRAFRAKLLADERGDRVDDDETESGRDDRRFQILQPAAHDDGVGRGREDGGHARRA